jgi:hypothetical protein
MEWSKAHKHRGTDISWQIGLTEPRLTNLPALAILWRCFRSLAKIHSTFQSPLQELRSSNPAKLLFRDDVEGGNNLCQATRAYQLLGELGRGSYGKMLIPMVPKSYLV